MAKRTVTHRERSSMLQYHPSDFYRRLGQARCGNTIRDSSRTMPGQISDLSLDPLDFNP
jgi:hypothetical protein